MAKPGSNDARKIAVSGAVDLSGNAMTDKQVWQTQLALEYAQGLRCSGCGRRIGIGIHLFSIDVTDTKRPIVRRCGCSREDCDFAEFARTGATYMELVEYVWLDEMGMEAPPYMPAVENYAKLKAKAAADTN